MRDPGSEVAWGMPGDDVDAVSFEILLISRDTENTLKYIDKHTFANRSSQINKKVTAEVTAGKCLQHLCRQFNDLASGRSEVDSSGCMISGSVNGLGR